MATWDPDAEPTVDFRLVQNTSVTLFWRSSLLDETVDWLQSHAYRVMDFEAGSWSSPADMYTDVAAALSFPAYFGCNLDAFNDCMADVASGRYGWDASADTGLVIVLRAFDAFTAADRRTAQIMLDIVAAQARFAILFGHRIICLVQSNDPSTVFEPVGAVPVIWNDAEWADTRRGL